MHHLGHTRSASRRDHLLHTPDTFVRTSLPGLSRGSAIVHAAPAMGAAFSMTTVEFDTGGTLSEGPAQRFVYVLDGELRLNEVSSQRPQFLAPQSYGYLPPGHGHTLAASGPARVLVFEKPYNPLEDPQQPEADLQPPDLLLGSEPRIRPTPLLGDEDLLVRTLLPASNAFDFAVNTMIYTPGASLAQVEVHHMEHGLLMLEGNGIYRLGDAWYPVQAGDVIWMGAFCPQWFGALGKQPARYLIYKDANRHVLA